MKEIFKSKTFWLTFVILSAIIYIALINLNRTYQSEIDILIIPKSEKAAINSEQIVENFKVIPESLAFFERMIKDDEGIVDDLVLELPSYKKKIYWNSKVKTERISNSGIVKISAFDDDHYIAENLSTQTVKNIIGSAGLYYNIKNDIDIRIIGEPITLYSNSQSKIILVLKSLVSGFILVFLSFLTPFYLFEKNTERHNRFLPIKENLKLEKTEKPVFEKEKDWFSLAKSEISCNIYNKKASAPDNLPIAGGAEENKETEKFPENEEKNPITREATSEEVKERLNKLLSGKL